MQFRKYVKRSKPIENRFVASVTALVLSSFVLREYRGVVPLSRSLAGVIIYGGFQQIQVSTFLGSGHPLVSRLPLLLVLHTLLLIQADLEASGVQFYCLLP